LGCGAQTLDDSAQFVYDATGRKFDASTDADLYINGSASGSGGVFLNDINPGNTMHGKIAFGLPCASPPRRRRGGLSAEEAARPGAGASIPAALAQGGGAVHGEGGFWGGGAADVGSQIWHRRYPSGRSAVVAHRLRSRASPCAAAMTWMPSPELASQDATGTGHIQATSPSAISSGGPTRSPGIRPPAVAAVPVARAAGAPMDSRAVPHVFIRPQVCEHRTVRRRRSPGKQPRTGRSARHRRS
jgi:hypothetical protein